MIPVRIRYAEVGDAGAVLPALSRQTIAEFEVAGLKPRNLISEAFRAGDRVYVSEADGRVLTMFGFNDCGGYYSMWTLATVDFFDLGAAGVRETRRFFRNLTFDKPLRVVTASPDPRTDRWLGLLGLKKVSERGIYRTFEMPR